MKTLLQCGLLSLFLAATLPAVPLIQTYDFTGTCTDCPDFGFGTLTASTSNNVVSFSMAYNSDWISYTIPSGAVEVDGLLFNGTSFTYNPAVSLNIVGTGTFTSFGGSGNPVLPGTTQESIYFYLNPGGNWSTGINAPSDFGTNGAFNLQGPGNSNGVPEPASIALVGAGTGLLILLQRRRTNA
jgi:hypothetical protein